VQCSRCSHWGYVHPFGTRLVTGHRDLVGDRCRASCFSLNRMRCKEYAFVALYPCVPCVCVVYCCECRHLMYLYAGDV
jgi:hypothetical protein